MVGMNRTMGGLVRMTALPPEQSAIDRKIVDELFDIVPDDWNAFLMSIEPRRGLDGGGFVISIVNPDVAGAEVMPTPTIRSGVVELATFFTRQALTWERLTYAGHLDEQGAWRLKITAPLPK